VVVDDEVLELVDEPPQAETKANTAIADKVVQVIFIAFPFTGSNHLRTIWQQSADANRPPRPMVIKPDQARQCIGLWSADVY
jgi:hypothetical protein